MPKKIIENKVRHIHEQSSFFILSLNRDFWDPWSFLGLLSFISATELTSWESPLDFTEQLSSIFCLRYIFLIIVEYKSGICFFLSRWAFPGTLLSWRITSLIVRLWIFVCVTLLRATCLLTPIRMSMRDSSCCELSMAEQSDWINQDPVSGERKL